MQWWGKKHWFQFPPSLCLLTHAALHPTQHIKNIKANSLHQLSFIQRCWMKKCNKVSCTTAFPVLLHRFWGGPGGVWQWLLRGCFSPAAYCWCCLISRVSYQFGCWGAAVILTRWKAARILSSCQCLLLPLYLSPPYSVFNHSHLNKSGRNLMAQWLQIYSFYDSDVSQQ